MNNTTDTRLIRTREDLRHVLRQSPQPVALVMAKGNIHDGHLAVVNEARRKCATVVVSLFVDPLDEAHDSHSQLVDSTNIFSQTLDHDFALLTEAGVDIVFAPSTDTMYPLGVPQSTINPGYLATVYEGEVNSGGFVALCHFTVKMLNLVQPDYVFIGQKDAQDLAVLRQVVRDFDFPVTLVSVPTVRDGQGIPISHESAQLSERGRAFAAHISRALRLGIQEAARSASADLVLSTTEDAAAQAEGLDIDYVALVDALSFEPLQSGQPKTACLLIAATFEDEDSAGQTYRVRIVDNVLVVLDK